MPAPIQDEFSHIVSRRKRYQLRMAKQGRCVVCGSKPTFNKWALCPYHYRLALRRASRVRQRQRAATGSVIQANT